MSALWAVAGVSVSLGGKDDSLGGKGGGGGKTSLQLGMYIPLPLEDEMSKARNT